ncbi:MAG: hypothetical protein PWQ22_1609 [Archaeoglobaceae archaeon]|nr:hypothetical protein [Archaeoglobaceae archaeon]MDK2877199.1 hypothetical protein [Archaeoglobaceae archaeon]
MKIDEIDLKIINILKEDSRVSISEIARELNLSRQTVKSRISRLEKEGIIEKYTVKIASSLEDAKSSVYLLVETDEEKFWEMDEIVEINRVTSKRYLVRITVSDLSELSGIFEKGKLEVLEIIPVIERKVKERPFRARITFRCDYCGKEMTDEPIVYRYRKKFYVLCCKTCLREFKASFG